MHIHGESFLHFQKGNIVYKIWDLTITWLQQNPPRKYILYTYYFPPISNTPVPSLKLKQTVHGTRRNDGKVVRPNLNHTEENLNGLDLAFFKPPHFLKFTNQPGLFCRIRLISQCHRLTSQPGLIMVISLEVSTCNRSGLTLTTETLHNDKVGVKQTKIFFLPHILLLGWYCKNLIRLKKLVTVLFFLFRLKKARPLF